MEILIIMAAVSLITVCGTIAYLAIKSSVPSTDFARMLVQIAENGLLSGDLDTDLRREVVLLPPTEKTVEILHYVHVDLLLIHLPVVETQTGYHDVSLKLVYDLSGISEIVHARLGQVVVAAEIDVVGGVQRNAYIQPLGNLTQIREFAEAAHYSGVETDEFVILVDGLVGIGDQFVVPDDLEHHQVIDLPDGLTDEILVWVIPEGVHTDQLDLHRCETHVVNVLNSILQCAPFTGQRYSGRSESDH